MGAIATLGKKRHSSFRVVDHVKPLPLVWASVPTQTVYRRKSALQRVLREHGVIVAVSLVLYFAALWVALMVGFSQRTPPSQSPIAAERGAPTTAPVAAASTTEER